MATEIKPLTDARWPASLRLPVALTFEHQSGEGAPLLPGDRPNAMIGGAMQYGARTGIWNILELLDTLRRQSDVSRVRHHGRKISGSHPRRTPGRP